MDRLKLLLCAVLVLSITTLSAQSKSTGLKFTSLEYSLGKIKEDGGLFNGKFEYTNTGADTLRITSVKSSCGCITCNWTKNPIPPKGVGTIDFILDPLGRPGPFSKGIEVFTNADYNQRITLIVRADVEAKQRTPADDYPHLLGNLRLNVAQISMQNVFSNEKKTDTLKLYNEWDKEMTFDLRQAPVYITCKMVPETLKPQQEGYLVLTYDAQKREDFGFLYDRFVMETNDTLQPQKQIAISLNITEDFSKMTPEQLSKAPKIEFENTTLDFGNRKAGEKLDMDFEFKNVGKSELIMRKVKGG
jgi:hypothetical protein